MRAALFDLDDTVLDRSGSLRDFVTWQATSMLRFSTANVDQYVQRFIELDQGGMVWKDKVYTSLIDEFEIVGWSVDDLLNAYLLTFCAFCKMRKGAVVAINEFRSNGFRIVLVTNGKSPFQEMNFQALDCSDLFDKVIVSEAVGLRKPEKAIFELACNVVDADIGSSVFVGDNPISDMQGAKQAGMSTIHVPINVMSDLCEHADFTYFDMSELSGFVKRMGC